MKDKNPRDGSTSGGSDRTSLESDMTDNTAQCRLSIMVPFDGMTVASLRLMIQFVDNNRIADDARIYEDIDPDNEMRSQGIEIITWARGV